MDDMPTLARSFQSGLPSKKISDRSIESTTVASSRDAPLRGRTPKQSAFKTSRFTPLKLPALSKSRAQNSPDYSDDELEPAEPAHRRELHDPFAKPPEIKAEVEEEFRGFGRFKPNDPVPRDSTQLITKLFQNTVMEDETRKAVLSTRTYKGKEALSRFYGKCHHLDR